METAFGIVLFATVYGPFGCLVYDELTGGRFRVRSLLARRARPQRRRRLELVSQSRRQS